MKPISFGNVIVWPRIPRLTAGVKLHHQNGNARASNAVVMPVIRIDRPAPEYNDIQKIIAATMRGQQTNKRMSRRNTLALEKLQRMWRNPA